LRPAAHAAEDGVEKVAVVKTLGAAEVHAAAIARSLPRVPARRWAEVLPGLVVGAQLVVGGALFRVAQHLVGFGDFLEARLGVFFLADVRVVFARQLAVGFFDLVGRGTCAPRP
jgi:hypothetical protein